MLVLAAGAGAVAASRSDSWHEVTLGLLYPINGPVREFDLHFALDFFFSSRSI
jgi:hypothetical protein